MTTIIDQTRLFVREMSNGKSICHVWHVHKTILTNLSSKLPHIITRLRLHDNYMVVDQHG